MIETNSELKSIYMVAQAMTPEHSATEATVS